jgi:hypothetical protein
MSVNDYNVDLYEAVEDLIDERELEKGTPAYGIAQQVIHMGYDSLSPKQRTLYDAVVIPALRRRGRELRIIQTMNSAAP